MNLQGHMLKHCSSSCSVEVNVRLSKQRKTGIDQKWLVDFPWLIKCDGGTRMKCSLCCKHSRQPEKVAVGRAVWVDLAKFGQTCITSYSCKNGS